MKRLSLYHGTTESRTQSLKTGGLKPLLGPFIYASSEPIVAALFAVGRAEAEKQVPLIARFHWDQHDWEYDPWFAYSYRSPKLIDGSRLTFEAIPQESEPLRSVLERLTQVFRIQLEERVRLDWLKTAALSDPDPNIAMDRRLQFDAQLAATLQVLNHVQAVTNGRKFELQDAYLPGWPSKFLMKDDKHSKDRTR